MKYFQCVLAFALRQTPSSPATSIRRNITTNSILIFFVLSGVAGSCSGMQQAARDLPATGPPVAGIKRTSPERHSTTSKTVHGTKELNELITNLALTNIPHQYTEMKDWGHQERRWNGLEIKREGGRIKTHRKWKMVNHGTWRKYSAELIDPKQEFAIELKNVREVAEGEAGFDLHFVAKLKLFARRSKWLKGIQLYSLSAEGHATVRLIVSFRMKMALDFKKMPPDMLFAPTATDAKLRVDEFRIDRVSDVGGEIAQQISQLARKELDKKIESKKAKLLDKINNGITKNADKLKLSTSQLDRKWKEAAAPFLPAGTHQPTGDQDVPRVPSPAPESNNVKPEIGSPNASNLGQPFNLATRF